MSWWIWVLIAFALLAAEFATPTMHIAFFAAGALVVALLLAVGAPLSLSVQLLLFTVISVAALLIVRPLLVRKLKLNIPTKIDNDLVGDVAIATEEIPVSGIGKAEMRGTTWTARNVGAVPIARGERCAVERVEGLILHLRNAG